MSFVPLYKNADRDANLVERKARIKPDYSILSTDSKPTLASADAGRILEETDTGDRFRWTGTQWIQTHTAGDANVSDGGDSITVDSDDGSLSTYHKPDYSQLSTVAKPTPAAGNEGVTLEETDTGNQYRWTGTQWLQTHLKGAIGTHDADVHNSAVNRYLHQHTGTSTTISTASAANDYQINVADTTGFIVGNALHINGGSAETTHPIITAITPGTPGIFVLDRRLDVAHAIGDAVTLSIIDLASQIGTLATPQEYWAGPEPGQIWHIMQLSLAMGHTSAGDFGLFGNQAALTNGVVLRAKVSGNYGTLTNWKTNGDIDVDTGSVRFPIRSGGGGTYGTSADGPFKNRTGAVMRFVGDNGDRFELYVQDDLTGLNFWNMKIQGHFEDR